MGSGKVFLRGNKLFKCVKKQLFMLKFCLVVDTEKFISFKQGNPRWNSFERLKGRINGMIKNFRYNESGFDIVYDTILKQKFSTTFMLVGSLFKPIKSPKFIEWGYHTYNHLPLTLVSDETVKEQIKNIYKAESFSPPLWMVEDIGYPAHKELRDFISRTWKKEKDFEGLLKKCVEHLSR